MLVVFFASMGRMCLLVSHWSEVLLAFPLYCDWTSQSSFSHPFYAAQFLTFSNAEQAAATALELVLEAFFRSVDMHEDILLAFGCQKAFARTLFVPLDSNDDGLNWSCKEVFVDIDVRIFFLVHKRDMAKLLKPWQDGKIQSEIKREVDGCSGSWHGIDAPGRCGGSSRSTGRLTSMPAIGRTS